MRKIICVVNAVLLVLLMGAATTIEPVAAQSSEDCARADQLVEVGRYFLAGEIYRDILKNDPEAECAIAGLDTVMGKQCAFAAQLREAGETDAAKAIYIRLLLDYPESKCAQTGFDTLVAAQSQEDKAVGAAQASAFCSLAQAEAAAGRFTQARIYYDKAVEADPTVDCAVEFPSDYEKAKALADVGADAKAWETLQNAILEDPQGKTSKFDTSMWLRTKQIGAWWSLYGGIVLYIIAFVLVGVAIFFIFFRDRLYRLDIGQFSLGPIALTPDPSNALIGEIEHALQHLETASGGSPHGVVVPDLGGQFKLPDTIGVGSTDVQAVVKFFLNLYNSLRPPKARVLSGVLQYDEKRGAGVTVRLVDTTKNVYQTVHTIWQKDLNPLFVPNGDKPSPEDYVKLAGAIAVWTSWEVKQPKKDRVLEGNEDERKKRFLGTNNWQSYLYTYLAAQVRQEADDLKIRECLLRRALTYDPENRYALYSLAVVEMMQVSMDRLKAENNPYQQAEEHLKRVKDLSLKVWNAEKPDDDCFSDRTYIFANYELGAILLYQYLTQGNTADMGQAVQDFKAAVNAWPPLGTAKDDDSQACIRLTLEMAHAGALLLVGRVSEAENIVKEVKAECHFAPGVLYNLACYYSTKAGIEKDNEAQATYLNDALMYLDGVFRTAPHAYASWAKVDPSLDAVRQYRGPQFMRLLPAEYALPETRLTEIEGIGPHFAKILREKGQVFSVEALLESGATPGARQALARKTDIAVSQLYDWVKMADLMRIHGVGGQYAELLLAADVDSVKELRQRVASSLCVKIKAVNDEKNLVSSLPGESQVAAWITEASKLGIVLVAG